MASRRNPEAGFTLPELLISLTIIVVITPTIALAIMGVLRSNSDTSLRLDASTDRQFITTYFADDAQGAKVTDGVILPANNVPSQCGSRDPGAYVLEIRSESFVPTNVALTQVAAATYYLVSNNNKVNGFTTFDLRRAVCEAATAPMAQPTSDRVLARNVRSVTASYSSPMITLTVTPAYGTQYTLTGLRRTTQ